MTNLLDLMADADEDLLTLEGVTHLDKAGAQALVDWDGGEVVFEDLQHIDVDAAETLADWEGGVLRLGGLRELPEDVAKGLAHWAGECLNLDSLTKLSTSAAAALGQWDGERLSLGGFEKIEIDVIAELIDAWQGDELALDGLVSLPAELAEALNKFSGDELSLDGLLNIDTSSAQMLSGWTGSTLRLCGLVKLSTDTAVALTAFDGAELLLDGLEVLAADSAKALTRWKGAALSLDGLLELSEEARAALKKWPGQVSVIGLAKAIDVDAILARGTAQLAGLRLPRWFPETAVAYTPQVVNRFGGIPLLVPGESMPKGANCKSSLSLALQLDLATLPLGNCGEGLLQCFVCADSQACGDSGCVKVRIVSAEGLVVCDDLGGARVLSALEITGWSAGDELPQASQWAALGVRLSASDEAWVEEDNTPPAEDDKLGGWPAWSIDGVANTKNSEPEHSQCDECKKEMRLLFQIASEDNLNIDLAGGGRLYIEYCPAHPQQISARIEGGP